MTTPSGGQTSASQLVQKLEELRRGARLTWRALAEHVPFDHSTMYRQATGRRPTSWRVVEVMFTECEKEIRRREAEQHGVVGQELVTVKFADLAMLRVLWETAWGDHRQ